MWLINKLIKLFKKKRCENCALLNKNIPMCMCGGTGYTIVNYNNCCEHWEAE